MAEEMSEEKRKMLNGEFYDAFTEQLSRERKEARELMEEFSKTKIGTPESTAVLKKLMGSADDTTLVEPPFRCDYGKNIFLGTNCFMNFDCCILDICKVQIGDGTKLGPGVHIYGATHPLDPDLRAQGKESGRPVTIGKNVWIGGGAKIMPGVTIGDDSVIAGGAVVTKDVPPMSLYGGNPAKFIKKLERGMGK